MPGPADTSPERAVAAHLSMLAEDIDAHDGLVECGIGGHDHIIVYVLFVVQAVQALCANGRSLHMHLTAISAQIYADAPWQARDDLQKLSLNRNSMNAIQQPVTGLP